jgi:hypothetical protein
MIDNKSAINLAKHPTLHGRSKHFDHQFHYIRDQVYKQKLEVKYCRSEDQLVDIMTKAMKVRRFKELNAKLVLKSMEELN